MEVPQKGKDQPQNKAQSFSIQEKHAALSIYLQLQSKYRENKKRVRGERGRERGVRVPNSWKITSFPPKKETVCWALEMGLFWFLMEVFI